ncbi:ribbon-helix-helix domain-containing protein [uncultured Methylobacterium sp.]|jgi:predicted DNA-binding ribbon-helix-helix protein|uniref:ribbon-helix-helix domain-containing protein n=1 Tax=uncultured Methylobacterium sp. TaxID=157278 RepID=UPI00260DD8DE|nr:ribbon-helix-helix domain-containing protein [uncultured Methylobacterium sp.]
MSPAAGGPDPGILKRSVMIAGHRTSVSLEAPFWDALRHLAAARGTSMQALIGEVDAGRGGQNLSSAIRVFVLRAVWVEGALPEFNRADRMDLPPPS